MDALEHLVDPHRYEERATSRAIDRRSGRRFDRLAFALRAVRLLQLPRTRVAVFPSNRLTVHAGREWGPVSELRWAMVGIPADATARSIVLALTEIATTETATHALTAALAAADHAERAN